MSLVYSRGRSGGAGGPGQAVAVAVDVLEEVVVDLGRALAAADQGDAVLGLEGRLGVEVAGVVQQIAAQVTAGVGDVRRGAGAQHEPAGAEGVAFAGGLLGVDGVELFARVVFDGGDLVGEADGAEFAGRPAAVVVELGAQRIEVLADVERVQPPRFLEVVQEREGGGGVGEGDQVGQERHLEVAAVQHHAGVPVEGRLVVQEQAVESVDGLGQTGQAQVERAEADGDEVVRGGHRVSDEDGSAGRVSAR